MRKSSSATELEARRDRQAECLDPGVSALPISGHVSKDSDGLVSSRCRAQALPHRVCDTLSSRPEHWLHGDAVGPVRKTAIRQRPAFPRPRHYTDWPRSPNGNASSGA